MRTQDRYSDELLEAVEHLLTVDDPEGEGRYFSGLQKYSAEPGETLGVVRQSAWFVLENYEDQEFGPNIDEDLQFLEVEARVQERRLVRLAASREVGSELALYGVAAGVALGGILLGNRFLVLVLALTGVAVFIFAARLQYARWQERNLRRSLAEVVRAKNSIRKQLRE